MPSGWMIRQRPTGLRRGALRNNVQVADLNLERLLNEEFQRVARLSAETRAAHRRR